MVCVVVSFLSGLAGFHPYMWLFKLFCDLFFCFVFFFRGRCTICNIRKYRLNFVTSQRTKYRHKFKCFQVDSIDPNIKILYLWGLEAQAKPHKTQVQSAQFL